MQTFKNGTILIILFIIMTSITVSSVYAHEINDECVGLQYQSTYGNIQWGCRGVDTFYCIDIFDGNWNMLDQAIACGNNLHSYSPINLNPSYGNYNWKVWSPNGYGGDGFEGSFSVNRCVSLPYQSTYENIQWECRGIDTFYCIDIFDSNWNMLYQAVACGDELHSYSPINLNLPYGNYNWKVWSPNGYGGDGFEGSFFVSNDAVKTNSVMYNNLRWEQGAGHRMSWDEATYYCDALAIDGYSDWRLPTKDELKGLVVCTNGQPTPLDDYFPCNGNGYIYDFNTPTIDSIFNAYQYIYGYWSNSTYSIGNTNAWYVRFDTGAAFNSPKSDVRFVRCVR